MKNKRRKQRQNKRRGYRGVFVCVCVFVWVFLCVSVSVFSIDCETSRPIRCQCSAWVNTLKYGVSICTRGSVTDTCTGRSTSPPSCSFNAITWIIENDYAICTFASTIIPALSVAMATPFLVTLEPVKGQDLFYVSPAVKFRNSAFCTHSVFMCFVWIWEQTAIISLYSINWLVFITDIKPSKAQWSLYVPPAVKFRNSAFCRHTVYLCVVCGSENKQRLFLYTALTDWFL